MYNKFIKIITKNKKTIEKMIKSVYYEYNNRKIS